MAIEKININNTEHELVASALTETLEEKIKLDFTNIAFGISSSVSTATKKYVTCSGFTPSDGKVITVVFQNENAATGALYLSFSNGTDYQMCYGFNNLVTHLKASYPYQFVLHDGAYASIVGHPDAFDLISVDDIDIICGATIQYASANDGSVTF